MPFVFDRFGLERMGQIVVRHIDWSPGDTGLVALRGQGAQELGLVLARRILPGNLRQWGRLTYDDVDHRVRPPAAYVPPEDPLSALGLSDMVLRRLPADRLARTLEHDGDYMAPVTDLIARRGLSHVLTARTHMSELDEAGRMLAMLLAHTCGDPRVVVVTGDTWLNHDGLRGALTRLAEDTVVVCVAEHTPPEGTEVVDLGDDGVYTHGEPRRPPSPPPEWLRWFVPDRLAGMPRPGRVCDLDEALDALVDAGITHVVCLEEEHHHAQAIRARGLTAWHLATVDMHAPDADAAASMAARIEGAMGEGALVALHCKAGLGRTGTIAAQLLMRRGWSMGDALVWLRTWNRRYVQTDVQLDYLRDLDARRAR